MDLIKLGQRLYDLRKEHEYSQEELAEKINVSRQAVSRWERGEVAPDTENLICLSELYGVSLDELVHGEKEVKKEIEVEEKEDEQEDEEKENKSPWEILNFIGLFTILISYFVASSLTGLWHPLWILFLGIPVWFSFIDAIRSKDVEHFLYPVFVVIIYLVIGFCFEIWHPSWVVFLTIPVFYILCSFFSKMKKRN